MYMIPIEQSEHYWNKILIGGYLVVLCLCIALLEGINGHMPQSLPLFDLVILTFALFRLVRVFVYDDVTLFIRRYFAVEVKEVVSVSSRTGWKRTVGSMLKCPGCVSIWLAPVIATWYFLTSYAWFPLFVVALAGFVSIMQVVTNSIKWGVEVKR